ncbi:MAG: HAD family hydrolase [Candidatus Limnocylindrales bacterium]
MRGGAEYTRCVLFDWGDTLMRDFPEFAGPMATWPRIEVCAHAVEALSALRSMGWLLGVATNAVDSAENDVWAALRRGGLDGLLDRVYCFSNVGFRKPSRDFFEFILRDLGLPRSRIVMVGDDFDGDVVGANAAGIRAVWVAGEREARRAGEMHRTIADLGDLPLALQDWTGIGTDRTGA